MLPAWTVRDVNGWPGRAEENRGVRVKLWIEDPNHTLWLRKSPRARSPYEPAIECVALALAEASGVPAARAELCEWNGSRGILVRNFLNKPEELHGGDRVLGGFKEGYDPQRYELHTPMLVYDALTARDPSGELWRAFVRMCAFDACIGNGDRHQGNWSLAIGPSGTRLAPLYDPAACLGVELQSAHPLLAKPTEEAIDRYVSLCPSGFGDGRTRTKHEQALAMLNTFPEWRDAASVVTLAVRHVVEHHLEAHLERAPSGWYAPEYQRLAVLLLRARLRRMERFL